MESPSDIHSAGEDLSGNPGGPGPVVAVLPAAESGPRAAPLPLSTHSFSRVFDSKAPKDASAEQASPAPAAVSQLPEGAAGL